MGIEACRLKMILGWAQIIERRFCEKVVADWRAAVGKR
jgi:hypothetical protein